MTGVLDAEKREAVAYKEAAARQAIKLKTLADLAQKLQEKYRDECAINSSLMERISHLESERDKAQENQLNSEGQLLDLQDQLHDMMLHLSSMQEIQRMPVAERAELQNGSLSTTRKR